MNAPFATLTVLQRFVFATLSANSALIAAIGGTGRIHPNVSPANITTRHLVHQDYGSVEVVKPIGGVISMVTMRWALTAWEPSASQQALEPLMEAAMAALVGGGLRGKTHRYSDGSRVWNIYADYVGPDLVELEVAPVGTWAPVREVYSLGLQQAS